MYMYRCSAVSLSGLPSHTFPHTPQVGSGGQDAKQDYIDGPLRPAFCANASLFPVNYETW